MSARRQPDGRAQIPRTRAKVANSTDLFIPPGALDSVNQTTPDDASDTRPTIQMIKIESIMCGLDKINHL